MQNLREPLKVASVDMNTFTFICKQPKTELYFQTIKEIDTICIATQETSDLDPDLNLSMIPLEYHEFADLFSKTEADKLLLPWLYDHAISLESRKALLFGTIYKLSPVELEALRKYITGNLRKGFICHSQFSCRIPIVFAKKADRTL